MPEGVTTIVVSLVPSYVIGAESQRGQRLSFMTQYITITILPVVEGMVGGDSAIVYSLPGLVTSDYFHSAWSTENAGYKLSEGRASYRC